MRPVGLAATAAYLPPAWMDAHELAAATGIPADVLIERFGLRGKHIGGAHEQVSDLAVEAGRRLLGEQGLDPGEVDATPACGGADVTSTW